MRDCRGRMPDENWIETIGAGLAMLCCVAAAWGVLILIGG